MPRSRSGSLFGGRLVLAALAGMALACSDERSGAGPGAADPLPPDAGVGADAPLDLSYLCGNRFLVTNARTVPVSVTYRVVGTGETGVVEVAAAPLEDPAVSEQEIETRTRGTVEILLEGRHVVARANEAVPCTPPPAPAAALVASAAESGTWTPPTSWPIVGVHVILLPNGKVLAVGRKGNPQVWDPASGSFSAVPSPAWLFCSGHALLPDGRVFFAGGHISDNHGLPDLTLFSPTGNSWASSGRMARGRWYPTTTVMGNGDVVILAGRDEAGVEVAIPEVWSNGSVRRLTGASRTLPYYPRAFLAPDGRLYVAGSTRPTRFLSLSGSGAWHRSSGRTRSARRGRSPGPATSRTPRIRITCTSASRSRSRRTGSRRRRSPPAPRRPRPLRRRRRPRAAAAAVPVVRLAAPGTPAAAVPLTPVAPPAPPKESLAFMKAVTAEEAAADAKKVKGSESMAFLKAVEPPPEPAAAPGAPAAAVEVAAATAPVAYPGDNAPKEQVAAWMAGRGGEARAPAELPVMAGLVESGLKNLDHGHADSVGFFQMRVGIWNSGAVRGLSRQARAADEVVPGQGRGGQGEAGRGRAADRRPEPVRRVDRGRRAPRRAVPRPLPGAARRGPGPARQPSRRASLPSPRWPPPWTWPPPLRPAEVAARSVPRR